MYKSITDKRCFVHKIFLFQHYSWIIFIALLFLFGCDGTENPDPNVSVRFFHSTYQYPTGGISHFLTYGDFNRDGSPDIAVTNYNTDKVAVLLRNSEKGNFRLHVDYAVGKGPGMVKTEDIDGDGYGDLGVVNQKEDSISLLYGKEDGTFEEAQIIALKAGAKPMALAFLDINKDGLADIIVAESGTGEVSYLLNAGNRNWGEFQYIPCGSSPRWLLPVDLDKNGEVDLVVSNRDSNNISVLLSQTASPFSTKVDYAVGTYPRGIETIDINGDTYLDLIIANAGSGNYSLLINDTHGGFTLTNTLQSQAFPMKILIEDLNEDGYLDILGLLYGELTLSTGELANGPFAAAEIFYGSQGGNFTYHKMINLGVGAIDIDKVDLNADTKKDLVFTLSGLNRVGVIYGDGKAFSRMETRPILDGDIGTMTFGDYNGDSVNEIIICSNRSTYFKVFQVNTDLSLTEKGRWDVSGVIQSIVSTPIDNNNNSVDLVFCERGVMGVTVYLNNGQGVFQKKGTYSVKEPTFSHLPYPSSVAVGDVNNDGKKDIVSANPGADTVSVLLGDGTGAFSSAKETIVGNYPMAVKLADVNRDGKLDLLFVSSKDPDDADDQSPSRFVCWFGNGDGTFDKSTQKRYATNGNPRGLLMVDLDRDGDLEAVTIHPTGQSVVIFGAKPDGTFVSTGSIKIGKNPKSVFSWDIDNNGFTDLISINGDSTISVVLNNGKLQFSSAYYYYAGHSPVSGIPFDIDKDGIYDLIIANNASNDISFVLGRKP